MSKYINKGFLVFDFDGTIIHLFKNYNLRETIKIMCDEMKQYDVDFSSGQDVFDVFGEIVRQTEGRLEVREAAFINADKVIVNAEMEATSNVELVTGVDKVFPHLLELGYAVGIATNNSVECVKKCLADYKLLTSMPIVGRIGNKPELLKPNSWTILEVARQMGCEPTNVIFIGDNPRDYVAALNAGCKFIGIVPTKQKKERMVKVLPESKMTEDFNGILDLVEETLKNDR